MTIDQSTFTPDQAAIYAAGYLEGLRDGKLLQGYSEQLVRDLGEQIDELRKDVAYWQRIANAPKIAGDLTPRVDRLAALATRQEAMSAAFRQQRRPWPDVRIRTIAA